MSELIVVGDLHVREDEPFFTAQKKFMNWFIDQEFNNSENDVLFLGDVFHKSKPSAKENYFVLNNFQDRFNFNRMTILHGNHEYSRKYGSALTPLKVIPNLDIITDVTRVNIGSLKTLMLPYFYKTNADMVSMIEKYENLHTENLYQKEYDYIFGHFSFIEMFGELIDISKLKGKRCFGHIHRGNRKLNGDGYLGVPIITREDEKGYIGKILSVDLQTKEERNIEVPRFLDYITLSYGELPKKTDTEYIVDVDTSPSYEMALEYYKSYNIRNISLTSNEEVIDLDNEGSDIKKLDSINQMMNSYFEKDNVSSIVKKKVLEVL